MDNLMQQDVAEKRIINGRYRLSQCVFTHHTGSLYLAVDNQQASDADPVFIHLFPKRSIGYEALPALFAALQQRGDTHGGDIAGISGCKLLTVLDCGWLGMSAYFVLTVPDRLVASQLKPLRHDTTDSRYQQAIAISVDLLQQGVISKGLTPHAFIVQPDSMYLLPTALLAPFQQEQREAELLNSARAERSVKRSSGAGRWVSLLGWGAAASVIAGGGGYAYYLSQQAGSGNTEDIALATAPAVGATGGQIAASPTPKPEVATNVSANDVTVSATAQETVFADVDDEENRSEALLIESTKPENVVEADTMQEQEIMPLSPNIEPMAARPLIPETAQPIVRHSEPTPPNPILVTPAPMPSLAIERDEQEILPVTAVMPSSITVTQNAKEAAAKEAAAKEAAAKEAAAKEAAAKEAAAKEAAAKEAAAKEAAAKEAAAKEAAAKEAAAKEAAAKEAAAKEAAAKEAAAKEAAAKEAAAKEAAAKEAAAKEAAAKEAAAKESETDEEAKQAETKTEDEKPDTTKKSELTAGGLTKEELVQKAYQAIAEDKLSEAAGKGAIYYIRLLKRLDRTNPQVNRLARAVVSAYHVKTRRAIGRKHKLSSQRLLWVAGRIIKEFNLAQMNDAHVVLQRRIDDEFSK